MCGHQRFFLIYRKGCTHFFFWFMKTLITIRIEYGLVEKKILLGFILLHSDLCTDQTLAYVKIAVQVFARGRLSAGSSETLTQEMIRYAISQMLWHDRWLYLEMCSSLDDPVKQNLQLLQKHIRQVCLHEHNTLSADWYQVHLRKIVSRLWWFHCLTSNHIGTFCFGVFISRRNHHCRSNTIN